MLKSEQKKMENLTPDKVAEDFRKRICTIQNFDKLSKKHKKIVFHLVFNLLEENQKTNSGYFLTKLLKSKRITYYNLTQYIYTYLSYTAHYQSEDFSFEKIQSYLQKMTTSKNFTQNTYTELACQFLSVDENLIKYGFGYRYIINFEKAYKAFENKSTEYIQNIIKEILLPNFIPDGVKPTEKDYEYYRHFVSENAILFNELLSDYCEEEVNFIKKKSICIWNFEYLNIMINKLTVKEQYAVFDLIKQLQTL